MQNSWHIFWFLPFALLLAFALFAIGSGDLRKDFILDRYAKTAEGTVDKTWKKKSRRNTNYIVQVRYTPNHNYTGAYSSSGMIRAKIDYAKPVRPKLTQLEVPMRMWNTLKVGDPVTVSYALSKGKFYERIYNPRIPLSAIFFLSLGGFFILGFVMAIVRIWQKPSTTV